MTRIAIIGGGISGLAAAFTIEQSRAEYALYESSAQLGGVLRTDHIEDCIIEAGPDSFLTEKTWASDFCRTLGLGDQLITSNDAARKTYILVRGRLVEMPDGLMFMVPTKILPTAFSPLFSWVTKFRMAKEFLNPPKPTDADESVSSLVERHYGPEMVDRLADPLLSGIYGGEAANLSVRAVLPRFAEMERTHGSLSRAMLAARKNFPRLAQPAPIFTSLKNGMQQLVEALIHRLNPSAIHTSQRVQSIEREAASWKISTGQRSASYDAVILAVPAPAAAKIVSLASPSLSAELSAIQYTSTITLALGYDQKVRQALPPGFGFLVPRREGKHLLAATFVHNKFPYRAPPDRAILRCAIAGQNAEAIWNKTDEEIVAVVRQDLQQILGWSAVPLFTRVYKWKSAMAQYSVGHLERLKRIESQRQKLPGLALAGNAFRGIGIPDCIRSGQEAAKLTLGI